MKKLLFLLPLLSSLVLVGCGTSNAPSSEVPTEIAIDSPRIIEIQATRFKYEPSEIRVKQGEDVILKIIDVDTDHGAMFGEMNVTYNQDETITLDTSTIGSYEFRCATFCGGGHMDMQGTVIVE